MKKVLLVAIMSSYAMSGFFNDTQLQEKMEEKRLCKIFIKKAHAYMNNMRDDTLAQVTLESYKNKVVKYCGKRVTVTSTPEMVSLSSF